MSTQQRTRGARKVLLVDDDIRMLKLEERILHLEGYAVAKASSGIEALRAFEETNPALVLLDIMMPEMDGYEVCRHLRETSQVPVIMVSARDGEIDIVKGFQVGADHYITKPFHSKELAARVKAVMRRSIPAAGPATPCYQMEDLVIDTEHRMVTVGDKEVLLTATEFTLLEYLARNAGFVLTIDQILQNVWGEGYMGDDVALVNTAVSRLRQKLGDNAREPKYIFTRPGIGYTMRKSQ